MSANTITLAYMTGFLCLGIPVPCSAHSSFVACQTSLPVSGHGGVTTAGGGSVLLNRAGSLLSCGSTVYSGESLVMSVQGTSGLY